MKIDNTLTSDRAALTVKKEKETGVSFWKRDISLSSLRGSSQFRARFFSEMALLLNSGMDIRRSLDIVEGSVTKERERALLKGIREMVIGGSSLSDALRATKKFELYDTMTLALGEETGTLHSVLDSLAVYYSKKIAQRRQIAGALTYPVLVLVTTLLSLVFMLNFIVPMFEDVFQRFQGELPALTKAVISLSDSFMQFLWTFLLCTGVLIYLALAHRKKEWYRRVVSQLVLRIPVARDIVMLTYKVRFCQTLTLLVSSRIHLLRALEMIRSVTIFYPLERALAAIERDISSGVTLSAAMESFPFFDRKMTAMTRVGEEVNRLDTIYEQLYRQYSEELDVKIKTMNNLLEPMLIIFVGLMVGVILISMYLPVFQLGMNIGVN